MDLTTLGACKSWAGVIGTAQDANIQAALTAASIYFLRMTGRGPRNWQNATQNPFNEPVSYVETYDGISGSKLWLRNFPIVSVSSVIIGGYTVLQSTSTTMPGWAIDDQGRAIVIRSGGASPQTFQYVGRYGNGYMAGSGFWRDSAPFSSGPQQIQISYLAGFNTEPVTNDLYPIIGAWQPSTLYSTGMQVSDGTYLQTAQNSGTSGTAAPPWSQQTNGQTKDGTSLIWVNTGVTQAPNAVIVDGDQNILADNGVTYFVGGAALTKVQVAPASGQYFLVSPGTYLFSQADAGKQVLISYTAAGTPADIILAVLQLVALNYKRRNWIGQRSVAMKDVGSTSYTLQLDPAITECIRNYTRTSMSS